MLPGGRVSKSPWIEAFPTTPEARLKITYTKLLYLGADIVQSILWKKGIARKTILLLELTLSSSVSSSLRIQYQARDPCKVPPFPDDDFSDKVYCTKHFLKVSGMTVLSDFLLPVNSWFRQLLLSSAFLRLVFVLGLGKMVGWFIAR